MRVTNHVHLGPNLWPYIRQAWLLARWWCHAMGWLVVMVWRAVDHGGSAWGDDRAQHTTGNRGTR